MNEVEKMYENAGIEPINFAKQGAINFTNTIEIDGKRYPDFTAEKQLELIKWLIIEGYIEDMLTVQISEENFEVCLADTFNELWQDLTDTDRVQIKEILE